MKLPFNDPWWKVVAWLIAALAALGAFIAAKDGKGTAYVGASSDDFGSDPDAKWCAPDNVNGKESLSLAGALSVLSGVAMRVGMMDEIDPWEKARQALSLDETNPVASERVDARVGVPDAIVAGQQISVPIDWEYTATMQDGSSQKFFNSEVGHSTNFLLETRVNVPQRVGRSEPLVVDIFLKGSDGQPLKGDQVYGFANFISPTGKVFQASFESWNRYGNYTDGLGHFYAGIHLEEIGAELEDGDFGANWKIHLYAQNVNEATEDMPPREAATYVGGDLLLLPTRLARLSNDQAGPPTPPVDDDDDDKKSDAPCQPENAYETYVE